MVGDDSQLDSFCEARDRIVEGSSIAEVAQLAVEAAGGLFSCDICELFLVEDGEPVREATFRPDREETAPSAGRSVAVRTYRSREPTVIDDTADDERLDGEAGYRSLLSVPLGSRGALQLWDRSPGAFDEQSLTLAEVFVGTVIQALERLDGKTSSAIPQDVAAEFLEIADVMMVALDADGTIAFVNRKAREVLGYEAGELPGRDWFKTCVPAPERTEVRAVFDRLIAGELEPAEHAENAVLTRDGEERIVEWHNTLLTDDGTITGTLSAGLDVTDQREAERQLTEEREKYRTLIEQFPNGLVTLFDEDHRYQIVGGQVFEQLGLSPEDVEGRRLEDVFPPENVEVLAPLYDGVFEGESGTADVTFEGRVFRVRVVPVRDDGGEIFAGMTISQDVTVREARKERLEASRKRYRALLEAVPDPVFVADAGTGEILEVNEAAEQFRGQPREEIVGLHQTDLHPDDEPDMYRQLFETHIADGGRRRRLGDGSQIYATTADGQEVPVEISAEAVEIDGNAVICGIFHDVSDQLEYERALTTLNGATRDLFEAEDPAEIGEVAVETVASVLDGAGAAVFLMDEKEPALRPVADALPSDIEGDVSDIPVFEPGESIAWRVFTDGETAVFADVRTDPAVHDPETPIRSEILVPLGDHGVLVAGRAESDAFDGRAVDILEILGETVEAALDRAERDRELREHEQALQQRTRDLEELEAINTRIRNVTRALVDADTRQDVEQAVCTELVEADPVAFAWIGDVDPVAESVIPRAWAGDHEAYLEEITRSLTDENAEPAVRATRTRERVSVPNTTADLSEEPWRDRAVRRGFRSVLSIPLLYQESFRGVLTLYATERAAFSETHQSVLSDLGELTANAEVAIDRAHALLADRATELEFKIRDKSCFFLRFAQESNCTLVLDEAVPQSDGSWLVFVRVSGGSTERLIKAAQRAPEVDSARVVGDDGDAVVQIRFTEPFIASKFADRGISVRNIAADGPECRMTVAVPPTVSIHRTVEVVSGLYPDSELIAKREQMEAPEPERLNRRILEKFTPRQREVAETAYRRGYFEDPRNASGGDLAEELGFSPSAFHRHIRAVERKTFETIFGDETPPSDRAIDTQRE